MSQRSIKAQITALLVKRDRLHDILRAYDVVINDVASISTARALEADRERVVGLIHAAQRDAAELAATLRTPKNTFGGHQL